MSMTTTAPMVSGSKGSCRTHDDTCIDRINEHSSEPPNTAQQHHPQHSKHRPSTSGYARAHRPPRAECAPLLKTEYLGVSSTTFARPLQRYIESPLRGRNGLGARDLYSVPGGAARERRHHRDSRRKIAQKRWNSSLGSRSVSASIFSVGQTDEGRIHEGVAACNDTVPVPAANVVAHCGLLTPVGPDWWSDKVSLIAGTDAMIAGAYDAASVVGGIAERSYTNNLLRRTESRPVSQLSCKQDERGEGRLAWQDEEFVPARKVSPSKDAASFLAMQAQCCGDNNSPCESSRTQSLRTAGRMDSIHRMRPRLVLAQSLLKNSGTAATCRNTPDTRQRPRVSGCWELLTGRKTNNAKCPRNKKRPQISTKPPIRSVARSESRARDNGESASEEDDLAWMGDSAMSAEAADRDLEAARKPKRRAWEAGVATEPLQYPTPAVRRSVTQFHQKMQRSRFLEGKHPLAGLPGVEEPETGVRSHTAVRRRRRQTMPPPARWPEESKMTPGDIFVVVEHCTACSGHRMSLHHNVEKYRERSKDVMTAVEGALAAEGRPIQAVRGPHGGMTSVSTKLTTERETIGGIGLVGAFEVQVTACLLTQTRPGPKHPLRSQVNDSITAAGTERGGILRSATVSSKLTSGKWPNPERVATEVLQTLRDWGALSGNDSNTTLAAINKRTGSASQWTVSKGVPATLPEGAPARTTAGTLQSKEHDAHKHIDGSGHFTAGDDIHTDGNRHREMPPPDVQADEEIEPTGGPNNNLTAEDPGSGSGTPAPPTAESRNEAVNGAQDYSGQRNSTETSEVEHHGGHRGGGYLAGDGRGSSDSAASVTNRVVEAREEMRSGSGYGNISRTSMQPEALPIPEVFSLVMEDVVVEGIEFAAEGSTADPFFLLRVGKGEAKSAPIADVPGGAGGSCSWPASGAITMEGVTMTDLRQSGCEVQVWDDLGWIIAKGKVSPGDAVRALGEVVAAINFTQSGPPLPPASLLTCTLEGDRGASGGGRATFALRVVEKVGTLGSEVMPTVATAKARQAVVASDERSWKHAHSTVAASTSNLPESASNKTARNKSLCEKLNTPERDAAASFDGEIDELLFSSRGTDPSSLVMSPASPGESDFDLSSFDGGGLGGSPRRPNAVETSVASAEEAVEESFVARINHNQLASGSSISDGKRRKRPTQVAADAKLSDPAELVYIHAAEVRTTPDQPPVASSDVSGGYSEDSYGEGDSSEVCYSEDAFDRYDEGATESHQPCDEESVFSFSTASSSSDGADSGGNGSTDPSAQEINRCMKDEAALNVAAGRLRAHTRLLVERWLQHAKHEQPGTLYPRILRPRRRLRRAAEKYGGSDLKQRMRLLFDKLDTDKDGQLSMDDLREAFVTRRKRTRKPSAKQLAALVAGIDRVGKISVNLPEVEAFRSSYPDASGGPGKPEICGVTPGTNEMAALWLRLRHAVEGGRGEGKGGHEPGASNGEPSEAQGAGEAEICSKVDMSKIGAGLFEGHDPEGSGCIPSKVFCEVIRGSEVHIVPPLQETDAFALCRHFGRGRPRSKPSGVEYKSDSSHPEFMSYRALIAWVDPVVDPVDVGRVAKRISRFLRAVGDPKSRSKLSLGASPLPSTDGPQTPMAVPEDDGSGVMKSLGADIAVGGGGEDRGDSTVEGVERQAVTDIFRVVDVNASGRISEDELLLTVNRLGLPLTSAEARLLVSEYGDADAGGELSLEDFDNMMRVQRRLS